MVYNDLKEALALFGLHENDTVTIKRIKERHRALLKEHHPDHGASDTDMIRRINEANRIITEYIRSYRFSFTEEEYYRQNPEEYLKRQFAWDPVWSGTLEEK